VTATDHARSIDITAEGRTLVGRAYHYERPSLVSDDGGRSRYWEEFARTCDRKTLAERGTYPLMLMHGTVAGRQLPIGSSTFERSADGLMFVAPLARTRDADEALELVNAGVLTDASVRYRSFDDRQRVGRQGPITTRFEIGIRELSLAPTGFGQHAGAEVLMVRSENPAADPAETPRLDALRRRRRLLITP
jgi:phage head maturation protease